MARIVVRFFDDETVEGVARDLDFDEPDFLVEVDDAGGLENNETAWIPLTAVKWVELQRDKELADTPTRKVAIRFLDGPEGMALVGDVQGDDADADRLAIARAEHGMQLDEHAAARRGEFDVERLSRSRLAQPVGEGGRQSCQRVFRLVMLVDRQSIEAGERLVHADEA